MIGQSILLSDVEQRICRHIAKRRHEINRQNGVLNSKKGTQSDELTDLEGFAGELAFCKMFNVFPDLEIKVTNQNTDDGDCKLLGLRVDIKTTKYLNGRLICSTWKNNNTDIFALIVGTFPKYTFKGFMSYADLCRPERIKDLGHGNVYCASQDELYEFELVSN